MASVDATHKSINVWQESDIKAAREYIEANVLSILFKALCNLVKERPDDPIQYVIDFLLKYKNGFPKDYDLLQEKLKSRRLTERRRKPEEISHWVEISLATTAQIEESSEALYDLIPQTSVEYEKLSASFEKSQDLNTETRPKPEEPSTSAEILHDLNTVKKLKSKERLTSSEISHVETKLKYEEPSLASSEISHDQQSDVIEESSSIMEKVDSTVKRWQMKWKKAFPTRQPQIENPRDGYNILPTRFYLEATVLSIIRDALDTLIVLERFVSRPDDPIQCIIDFMNKHKALYS